MTSPGTWWQHIRPAWVPPAPAGCPPVYPPHKPGTHHTHSLTQSYIHTERHHKNPKDKSLGKKIPGFKCPASIGKIKKIRGALKAQERQTIQFFHDFWVVFQREKRKKERKKCSFQWIGFGPDQRIFEFFLHTWPVWHLNWLFNWKQEFLDQYFVAKIRKQICIFFAFFAFFPDFGWIFFSFFQRFFWNFRCPGQALGVFSP